MPELILLPQAPYGGLLLPIQVAEAHDGPREDFVLYFDDVEYTRRMTREGVSLYLARDATINEVAEKWTRGNGKVSYLRGMIQSGDFRKIYFSYRNGAFVDLASARDSSRHIRFIVNVTVYTGYVLLRTIQHDRWFARIYFRALTDGLRGKLGNTVKLSPAEKGSS